MLSTDKFSGDGVGFGLSLSFVACLSPKCIEVVEVLVFPNPESGLGTSRSSACDIPVEAVSGLNVNVLVKIETFHNSYCIHREKCLST